MAIHFRGAEGKGQLIFFQQVRCALLMAERGFRDPPRLPARLNTPHSTIILHQRRRQRWNCFHRQHNIPVQPCSRSIAYIVHNRPVKSLPLFAMLPAAAAAAAAAVIMVTHLEKRVVGAGIHAHTRDDKKIAVKNSRRSKWSVLRQRMRILR